MKQIHPHLYIGSQEDYEAGDFSTWKVVQACKEPYHRQALGYTGRSAPKDHPEYLFAYRDNRLILNLIDSPNLLYIPRPAIDTALDFIRNGLAADYDVLVHCNQGLSRSPTIGWLYLAKYIGRKVTNNDFRAIYPDYAPSIGMYEFAVDYLAKS